jgi:hypothetical protein
MINEKKAYNRFRLLFKGRRFRMTRVENVVAVGMPDVNLCINGHEHWIEIKAPTEPKRKSTPLFGSNHRVEKEQANWMLDQLRNGGNGWFLIATDKRFIILHGSLHDEVNSMTVPELMTVATFCCLNANVSSNKETICDIFAQNKAI